MVSGPNAMTYRNPLCFLRVMVMGYSVKGIYTARGVFGKTHIQYIEKINYGYAENITIYQF